MSGAQQSWHRSLVFILVGLLAVSALVVPAAILLFFSAPIAPIALPIVICSLARA